MSLTPLYNSPGISKVNSAYANINQQEFNDGRSSRGRFNDGNYIRFVAGFPEKIGGWATVSSTAVTGVPRGMLNWSDLSNTVRTAVGTNNKLWLWSGGVWTDITPYRAILTGTLGATPLTTVSGSSTVTVTHASHGLSTNDYVQLTSSAALNGLTISGTYYITKLTANTYTINAGSNATGSSSGGGTVTYIYYRVTLGASPFATINTSATVTVTNTAHGAAAGDYVSLSGAAAVAGLTISGEYQIVTVVSANTYTITASGTANATATGGGSAVQAQYDIASGLVNTAYGSGYGTGGYGATTGYGTTGNSFVINQCETWTMAAYGQQLLCAPYRGLIYVYDPSNAQQLLGNRAYPMYGAPTVNAFFVTPERFIFALAPNGQQRQISWPDQNSYNTWTSTATNTANSGRTIQSNTPLVGGIPVRDGASLFFTFTSAIVATYTGDNFVYSTTLAAEGAGCVGPLAMTTLNGMAFWMSDSDFWMWNGTVAALPSEDIRDYVFRNINTSQLAKCVAGTVRAKREVWFFYPSSSSNEIDSYVIFHTDQQCFSIGSMQRTCWSDKGLYSYPTAFDASGNFYYHENGTDANGSAMDAYVSFAPLDISSGDVQTTVQGFWPDFERIIGNITLTVLTRQYPMDADTITGPFTIPADGSVPRVDFSSTAHMVGYKIESNAVGGDFRLGLSRAEIQGGGARR